MGVSTERPFSTLFLYSKRSSRHVPKEWVVRTWILPLSESQRGRTEWESRSPGFDVGPTPRTDLIVHLLRVSETRTEILCLWVGDHAKQGLL